MIEKIKNVLRKILPVSVRKFILYIKPVNDFYRWEVQGVSLLDIASSGLDEEGDSFVELKSGETFYSEPGGHMHLMLYKRFRNILSDELKPESMKTAIEIVQRFVRENSVHYIPPKSHYLYPGWGFVDLGAHTGYAALKAAKKVGPAGRVVAVEANPSSIRLLKKNIQAHNPDNLTMVHAAVYNANQPVSLFTGGGQNNSLYEELHDQLYDDPVFRYEKSETVPGKTVDTLLEEAGFPVDTMPVFISFEINGAEVSALEGMTGFFSRSPHFVLRIAARSAGKNQPSRAKELSKKLSAYSNVSIRNVPPFIYAFRYPLA